MLVPGEKHRDDGAYYKTGTSDSGGSIAIKGIPPGEYTLFAWEYVDAGAWYNPDFIREQMPNGVAIKIDSNGELEVRIRAAAPK